MDLLPYIPGYQVTYDQTLATNVPLINVRGQHGANLLLLYDGAPLNDHSNSNTFIFNRYISLDNIERVEVMRGPGSALYGSAAFAGIINLIPRSEVNQLRVEGGLNGHRKAGLNLGKRTNAWGVDFYAQAEGDDGERYDGVFDQFNRDSVTRDPRQFAEFSFKGHYGPFSLTARHTHNHLEDFYQFGALGNDANSDKSEITLLRASYEGTPWDGPIDARISAGWRQYKIVELGLALPAGTGPATSGDFLVGPYFKQWVSSVDGHFTWDAPGPHALSWGFSYERALSPDAFSYATYDYLNAFEWLGDPTVLDYRQRFVENVGREVNGLYLQDQISGYDWSLTLGARYDNYSDFGEAISPQITGLYWLTPNTQIKAIYGEAFQAPSMGVLYANSGMLAGNRDLRPERIRTASLSIMRQESNYAIDATLFWSRTHDMIANIILPSSQRQRQNVGEHETIGVELGLTAPLGDAWKLETNLTLLPHNSFESSGTLSDTAPNEFVSRVLASASLSYQEGPWKASLSGNGYNHIPALPRQGSVILLNAAVERQFQSGWVGYIHARNLLNHAVSHASISSALGTDAVSGEIERAAPGRGFGILLGARWNFSL
ncbi:putative Colicin I receptor [Magnetofaba australis IT-1]|uniref:Putative Colicin I receptor n=2 Tax=Magnetofaba TaxID=1472292 RepID=A0A1Y2K1W4_9PROT|nr:putative Colicin I receptor [Magnetofaba australis IT-1]